MYSIKLTYGFQNVLKSSVWPWKSMKADWPKYKLKCQVWTKKKKKLDSMLTSSFQTVIKRYNSNSQKIKIEMLIWHSRAKFILTLIFFAPKIIWDPPGKKEVFMDYHTIEKKRELRFDLVIIPHWGIKSTYKFDTSL